VTLGRRVPATRHPRDRAARDVDKPPGARSLGQHIPPSGAPSTLQAQPGGDRRSRRRSSRPRDQQAQIERPVALHRHRPAGGGASGPAANPVRAAESAQPSTSCSATSASKRALFVLPEWLCYRIVAQQCWRILAHLRPLNLGSPRLDRGTWRGLESQSNFVRAASSGA
jgi:hypothetical protein